MMPILKVYFFINKGAAGFTESCLLSFIGFSEEVHVCDG